MKLIALASTLLLLASCGQKDPLAGQPDYIRNATPGFEKAGPEVASDKNMIISSNATHFFFTEGVEGQTTITGRILLDNYEAELAIDNLADFPGATFDPSSGIFSWKPQMGVVGGINSTFTTVLRVRLNGLQRATNITATRTEDFPVTISRQEHQPTIVREAGFPNAAVREGDSLRLTIFVKDIDGVKAAGAMPRIVVQAPVTEPRVGDLTPFIRVVSEDAPEQDFSDPTLWKFTLNVALTDADLTKNTGDFFFRVTALSRFGKYSPAKEYKVTVLTSVSTPIVSAENFEVATGTTMISDVLFFDPRQEGIMNVEVLNPFDLPTDFTFTCSYPPATVWMAKCRAQWPIASSPIKPAAGAPIVIGPTPPAPTDVMVQVRATNRSPVSYDKQTNPKTFNLNFKVVSP